LIYSLTSHSTGEDANGQFVTKRHTETAKLLWAGGWDSTFRMLELIVSRECVEMKERFIANGFQALMDLTWFCCNPVSGKYPCGVCNPCVYAIEEGMAGRITIRGRLRYHLSVSRRIWSAARKYRWLYNTLNKLKSR